MHAKLHSSLRNTREDHFPANYFTPLCALAFQAIRTRFFNSMADFPEKKNPLLGVEFRVLSLLSFPSVVLLAAV